MHSAHWLPEHGCVTSAKWPQAVRSRLKCLTDFKLIDLATEIVRSVMRSAGYSRDRLLVISLLLLVFAIGERPQPAYAKQQRVTNVIGYGENEDVAIRMALRDAVARACGERISASLDMSSLSSKTKTLSNNGRDDRSYSATSDVSSNIATTTDGIVSRYDVISSKSGGDGNQYTVTLNVVVDRCLIGQSQVAAPSDYSEEFRQINSALAVLGERQLEKRSKIVSLIASVDIPPNLRGHRNESQADELRRLAIEAGKPLAAARVKASLGDNDELTVDDKFGLYDVSVLSVKDLPEWNGQYSVKLEAEVSLFRKEGPSSQANSSAPLTVSVRTDKIAYREGEEIFLYVKGNKDFYGRITYEDASGAIIQVLPNLFRGDTLFKGGVVYRVPGEDDRFRLRVSSPFGRERFTVYGSTGKLGEISVKAVDAVSGLRFSSDDRTAVARKTRGLSVEQANGPLRVSTNPLHASGTHDLDFVETSWEISTVPNR